MKIGIASDHAGFNLKKVLLEYIKELGHEVVDYGTNNLESTNYAEHGLKCALAVKNKAVDLGIVICQTGIGISIMANKVKGIRCSLVTSTVLAKATKDHNDSNVLALGASVVSENEAKEITKIWLETPFSNEERHARRVQFIKDYEEANHA